MMLIDKPIKVRYEVWVQGRCVTTARNYYYAAKRFKNFAKELADVEIRTVRVHERAG